MLLALFLSTLQAPTSAADALHAELARTVLYDVDGEGRTWAAAATYKASFGREGATYIPCLGARAPRNQPLALRVDEVRIGGASVAFATDLAAARDGDEITFDRGAVREIYRMAPRSMEQLFVVDAAPRNADIEVVLALESDLVRAPDGDGYRFEGDFGGVRYGAATALDADGRSMALAPAERDGHVVLRVPQAFVAAARFPLTIDPILSTDQIAGDYYVERAPDVAFDADTSSELIVFEKVYSSTDHDVIGVQRSLNGTILATRSINVSTEAWVDPRVANHAPANQFLVVAEVGGEIRGRTWAAFGARLGTTFTISGAEPGNDRTPDVGGEASELSGFYCIVWDHGYLGEHDIHYRCVREDGTLIGPGTRVLDGTTDTEDRIPTIGNGDGVAPGVSASWSVAWERETTNSNHDIWAARLTWDGVILSPSFPVAATSIDERFPSVSSILDETAGQRPWLVAWQQIDGADERVLTRAYVGSTLLDELDVSAASGPHSTTDDRLPSVDTDGRQFAIAVERELVPSGTTFVHAATIYLSGGVLGISEPFSLASGTPPARRPRITMHHSGGATSHAGSLVFEATPGTTGQTDIWAAGYGAAVGGPTDRFCAGTATQCPCGNGGANGAGCGSSVNPSGAGLSSTGAASISEDSMRLLATGMPMTTTCLFFQGTLASSGTTFGDGLRCVVGTVVRLATGATSTGFSEYPSSTTSHTPIHIQGNVPALGAARFYQTWYRNSASFCTSATFNLTNGISAVWVP